jgi:hypothetical protein
MQTANPQDVNLRLVLQILAISAAGVSRAKGLSGHAILIRMSRLTVTWLPSGKSALLL